MDLPEFLAARLDEDEHYLRTMKEIADRRADAATPADMADALSAAAWALDDPQVKELLTRWPDGTVVPGDHGRLLREVGIKRAILTEHGFISRSFGRRICPVCWTVGRTGGGMVEGDPWPCRTVRQLAAAWDARPDYDPAWAPSVTLG